MAPRPEKGGPPLEPDEEPGSVIRLFANDLQHLQGGGYHMDCFEVNAVNYGAPQLRERAICIGNRFNAVVDFPDPTHGVPQSGGGRQPTLFPKDELLPWATLGDAISDLHEDDSVIMDFSPRKKRFLSLVPPGSNWRSLPPETQQESMGKAWIAKGGRSGWWRRLNLELPCPTLITMPNHASTSLCLLRCTHPNQRINPTPDNLAIKRCSALRTSLVLADDGGTWTFCQNRFYGNRRLSRPFSSRSPSAEKHRRFLATK